MQGSAKRRAILLAIFVAAFVAASVVVSEATPSDDEIKEIRIGYQPSTHQIAEMIAMEKGWWLKDLKRFGVENVVDREFPSGPPEMNAMLAGEIDVAYVGTAPPITAIANSGLDAKIVAAVQINGSALVLRPELASKYSAPEDLRGLKIATFPAGSIQYTILSKWLKENGLDPKEDVEIREMGPHEAISAIEAGAVDAVFLPAPSPTIIELDGKGVRVVQSGEMYPNHACCCLLVSGKLIREHPEIVEQIVRTHINATKYLKEHPEEAARIFSNKTGFDYEKTLASFERWDGDWITNPHEMINSTLEYARVNYELGLAKRLLTEKDLFDTTFYDKIMGISTTPMPSPTPPTPSTPPTTAPTSPTPEDFTAISAVVAVATVCFIAMIRRRR